MEIETENYEEAKIVTQKIVNGDYYKHRKRATLLVPMFLGTVATAVAAGLSIYFDNPCFAVFAPDLMMFMSPSIIPHLKVRHLIKSVNNGHYFDILSKEEVLENAKQLVTDNNEYERNKMGDTKETIDDSEGFTL